MENARRLRTQILGAHLIARESRPVEQEHVNARTGQRPCGRRTGRPAPDDDYLGIHAPPQILATAPIAELTALTPSFVSHPSPPEAVVAAPQLCTKRSVARLHSGHRRRAWSVAPNSESAVDPMTPPMNAAAATRAGHPISNAMPARNAAPAMPAAVPEAVTPPDVPGGTGRHVRIERGAAALIVPISVAHVSEVDAASAPEPMACQSVTGCAM